MTLRLHKHSTVALIARLKRAVRTPSSSGAALPPFPSPRRPSSFETAIPQRVCLARLLWRLLVVSPPLWSASNTSHQTIAPGGRSARGSNARMGSRLSHSPIGSWNVSGQLPFKALRRLVSTLSGRRERQTACMALLGQAWCAICGILALHLGTFCFFRDAFPQPTIIVPSAPSFL